MLGASHARTDLEGRLGGSRLSEVDLVRFCSEIFPKEPMSDRFVNEARYGLSRLLPSLVSLHREHLDVLEIGAGSCILSAYLASKQLSVTALEPLGPEFDFFADLQGRVLDFCRQKSIPLKLVRVTGEQLELPQQFDFAFTINALEHMRDPLVTIDNMCGSLKPGGLIFIHCPNYTIPFDSHFNILLITRSKWLNEWLYQTKINRSPDLWNELNFIRYVDVRRHLVHRCAGFAFNHSVMQDLVIRLVEDPIFAERMPFVVRAIGATLRYTGLIRCLNRIPARFQTPMEVTIKKSEWAVEA